jgi:hypothetical protein
LHHFSFQHLSVSAFLCHGLLRGLDTTVTQPDEVASSYREALSKLS